MNGKIIILIVIAIVALALGYFLSLHLVKGL